MLLTFSRGDFANMENYYFLQDLLYFNKKGCIPYRIEMSCTT